MPDSISQNQDAPHCNGEPEKKPDSPVQHASPSVTRPEPPPSHPKSDTKKRDWFDYAKAILEIAGLVVLCVYAAYTIKIYSANHDAAVAAQKQTELLAKQLKGTEAAFLEVSPVIGTQVGDFDSGFNVIKVVVRNSGHAIATDVVVHISVVRMTIDGKYLAKPLTYEVLAPALDYKSGTSELYRRYVFEDSEHAAKTLEAARHLEQTVRIEWYYSYGDGFEDTIKSETFCRQFLSAEWVPCENFPALLHDIRSKQHTTEKQ